DPGSPWPHLVLGMFALEEGNWTEGGTALRGAVRADPNATFMLLSGFLGGLPRWPGAQDEKTPTHEELTRLIEDLLTARPDHPGGYDLRADYLYNWKHDYRAALADFRTAQALTRPDYPRGFVVAMQLTRLERIARWGEKLPAVLRGEIRPG